MRNSLIFSKGGIFRRSETKKAAWRGSAPTDRVVTPGPVAFTGQGYFSSNFGASLEVFVKIPQRPLFEPPSFGRRLGDVPIRLLPSFLGGRAADRGNRIPCFPFRLLLDHLSASKREGCSVSAALVVFRVSLFSFEKAFAQILALSSVLIGGGTAGLIHGSHRLVRL